MVPEHQGLGLLRVRVSVKDYGRKVVEASAFLSITFLGTDHA